MLKGVEVIGRNMDASKLKLALGSIGAFSSAPGGRGIAPPGPFIGGVI